MSYKLLQDLTSNQISNTSDPRSMGGNNDISVHVVYSDLTPALKTFIDGDVAVVTDIITISSHGFITGLMGRLTTTGTLPAGLALATDYFVIKIDDNSIKLASSYDNAIAGTAIDITGAAGTGTHTFTPVALNAVVKLQASGDNINWLDIAGETTTITASGSAILNITNYTEPLFRCVLTQTSGQGVLDLKTHSHITK